MNLGNYIFLVQRNKETSFFFEFLTLISHFSTSSNISHASSFSIFFFSYYISVHINFTIFSSTSRRTVGYCHDVVSVVPSSVRPFVRACVRKLPLQKTSQKLLTGFLPNFTEIFLRRSSSKFLQIIVFHEEFWLP